MDERKKEPRVGYKWKILCLVELLDEQKERKFLIQIYTMIDRHIKREAH